MARDSLRRLILAHYARKGAGTGEDGESEQSECYQHTNVRSINDLIGGIQLFIKISVVILKEMF